MWHEVVYQLPTFEGSKSDDEVTSDIKMKNVLFICEILSKALKMLNKTV